jgi:hypothetical protein
MGTFTRKPDLTQQIQIQKLIKKTLIKLRVEQEHIVMKEPKPTPEGASA